MALTTLPYQDYIERVGNSITTDYTTLSIKFGDGYEQTADNGLNNETMSWDVTYKAIDETKADAVIAFLKSVRKTVPFYATPKGETQQIWKLDSSIKKTIVAISTVDASRYYGLSFTLKRVIV